MKQMDLDMGFVVPVKNTATVLMTTAIALIAISLTPLFYYF